MLPLHTMSEAIHSMFTRICPRYDLANDVLSFGLHRLWRKALKRAAKLSPGQIALDLCTGTGDVAIELKQIPGITVIGADFVFPMLRIADEKSGTIPFIQGDTMRLPFRSEAIDLVSVSFGIRNVDSPLAGLKEINRILSANGKVLVMEFGQPQNRAFSALYNFYSKYIMPCLGGILSGDRSAYEYLPESAGRFPCRENFLALMKDAGFSKLNYRPLCFGIAYLYEGIK